MRPFLGAGVVVDGRVRVVTALWCLDPAVSYGERRVGFRASVPFWHVDERAHEAREPDEWLPNERFEEARTR